MSAGNPNIYLHLPRLKHDCIIDKICRVCSLAQWDAGGSRWETGAGGEQIIKGISVDSKVRPCSRRAPNGLIGQSGKGEKLRDPGVTVIMCPC